MARQKSSAQIHVADGAGGMRPIVDLRFEDGEWPIILDIPAKDTVTWMAQLHAEVEEHGWNASSFSQLDTAENSGTLTVHTASGESPPILEIVWERKRNAALRLRARPGGTPKLSLDVARDFIDAIGVRQRAGRTLREHCQALLIYDGLPWRGELWLDSEHRLGPPSKHPNALLGPQVLLVDAIIEGIGRQGVAANFQRRLHELRVFLSVVLGLNIQTSRVEDGWVCGVDDQGRITDCTLRLVGYVETARTPEFPPTGGAPPIERRSVTRPGVGPMWIASDMKEQWVPADIEELWGTFTRLSSRKREHFLRAGNAYLIAQSMWPSQRTAYAAFLVVACEALKPPGKRYNRVNVYDVIASFVGQDRATQLQKLSVPPQRIRSKHLHRGELAAGELLPILFYDHFMDPSFNDMLRNLSAISRVCLIEWLRFAGEYKLVRVSGRPRRWWHVWRYVWPWTCISGPFCSS